MVIILGLLLVVDQISSNLRMIPGAVLEDLSNSPPEDMWLNTKSLEDASEKSEEEADQQEPEEDESK